MRTVRGRLAALVLAIAALVFAPMTAANADAYGCHKYVCINVPGHGDYVGKVTISHDIGPRKTDYGYFRLTVDGTSIYKWKARHLHNLSYFHSHRWSSTYTFDRTLHKGAEICGTWHSYREYGVSTACEFVGG